MITGKKLLDLLDQEDKTDRDLIRYVCNGLQAYTVNQTPIDSIWLVLSGLREAIKETRLPGSGHYGDISPSSSFARDYHNDLKKLSLKSPRTFDDIRDTLIPRDMDLLARFLLDRYFERQDVERFIKTEIQEGMMTPDKSIFSCDSVTAWDQVELKIVNDYTVEITAGGQRYNKEYAEIGLSGRGKGPSMKWELLKTLAQKNGMLQTDCLLVDGRKDLKKRISQLRKDLKNIFPNINDDPFEPWQVVNGYRTRFKLFSKT